MRPLLTLLHRVVGLALAGFLALAGLTGAVIALYHEIDEGLNPQLYETPARGAPLATDELVARIERADPRARVSGIPVGTPAGRAAVARVVPREVSDDPLGFDEVFVDPVSGAIVGKRQWGACCFGREELVPFLYVLHYSLHLPERAGVVLMGCVGVAWVVDCFVALALTFPRGGSFWRRWRRAFRVEAGASRYRLLHDVHQATGLWLWPLLLLLAVSGVALSLRDEVFRPVVALFSSLSPTAEERARTLGLAPGPRTRTLGDAIAAAREIARARGFPAEPVYAFHDAEVGGFAIGFVRPGEDAGVGMGASWITVGDGDLRFVSAEVTGEGSAGDVFAQLQFPLHSGHLLGFPGRVAVSLLGFATAGLAGTGIVVWWTKRKARRAGTRGRLAVGIGRPAGGAS